MKQLLLIAILVVATQCLFSQTVTVLDDEGNPLPAAHITYKGLKGEAKNTILTTKEGKAVIPSEFTKQYSNYTITLSYVGFHPTTDTIKNTQTELSYQLKPTPVTLNQFVITAQYSPSSPEKAVHKIKIIDRKKIDAQGAVTLRDVLQNETNIRLSQDNVLGSSVSIQGISGQNVKILIDGVPVVGRLNGNVDLSQINLNDIERIEIVEGPLSVNYGTDALAGTINLITKKDQKENFDVGLNSYYETVGQYNIDGRLGWKFGKHRLSLTGGRNYFDGWSPSDEFIRFPESLPADTNRVSQWNPKEQYFTKLQYTFNTKKIMLRPYGEYFTETITNKGLPREPYYETAFDDYYNTWRTNVGIDASGSIGQNMNFSVLAAQNNFKRIKNTFFKDLTTLEQELTENPSDQDTSKFELWMSRGSITTSNDSAKVNYQLGYDINYETAYGKRIEDLERQQGDYALFASTEIDVIKNTTIRPGLRVAYNTAYDAPLIPSLNVKHGFSIKKGKGGKLTFRASYAKGFRAPTLKELHFEFVDINHNIVGNPDIEAEQSNNFHFNTSWQKIKGQSVVKLEVGAYYNDITNLITLAQTSKGAQYTYINIGRFKTLGFQGNSELAWEHMKLSIGGAYIGRYNSISEILPVSSFSFAPEVRSSLIYDFHKWGSSLAAFYKYTGTLPGFATTDAETVTQTTISSYHMLDITFTKHFWKKRIAWSVGGKNLLDVQNIISSRASGGAHSSGTGTVPISWGRSLFTKLVINFGV